MSRLSLPILALVACVALAVSAAGHGFSELKTEGPKVLTQQWYTDAACTQGENIVQVDEGKCYLDSADYSGLRWVCQGTTAVAEVFNYGDMKCANKKDFVEKAFPPGTCVGPIYGNLYLIMSGC